MGKSDRTPAKMLIAVGLQGRGCVLGYRGDLVTAFLGNDYNPHQTLDPRDVFGVREYPQVPGLYRWDGEIWLEIEPDTPEQNGGFDYFAEGTFRTAAPEDLKALMGVFDPPLPPEDCDDDGRDSPNTIDGGVI